MATSNVSKPAAKKLKKKVPRATKPVKRTAKPIPKPSLFSVIFKQPLFWLILAYVGSFLVLLAGFYLLYHQTILSFKVSPVVTAEAHLRADRPVRVTIPSAQIELPIVEASIQDGIWETSQTAVTHLSTSARPAEQGNVVLYGHNLKHLFGNLPAVRVGDEIVVSAADNQNYRYRVTQIDVVDPDQIQTVLPTDHEVLTVYTCTGFLDSKRLVLKATPVKIESL